MNARRFRPRRFILICIALGTAGPVRAASPSSAKAAAPGALAIRNPGFEIDENGDGLPDHWTFAWKTTHNSDARRAAEKTEPDWGWDRQVKHSGSASVRCGVARPVDDGVWSQDAIPLPPGVKYLKITAWLRAQGVNNGMGSVGVVFLGENDKWLEADYTAISALKDCDWTLHSGYAQVPKGAQTMRIRCWVNFNYKGAGTFWFDDLEAAPVDKIVKPNAQYVDLAPRPEPSGEETDRGYMLFTRSCLRLLFSNSKPRPEERLKDLTVRACPGEREPAVLAIHALRDLRGVKVSVSDLKGSSGAIPSKAIDTRSVRFLVRAGQSRWGMFHEAPLEVPLFLDQRERIEIGAGRTQPFWLTAHVPEDALPGTYHGAVTVEAEGAASAQLPFVLEVYPFHLAEPRGIFFAMYERQRSDPEWIAESFADMHAHGMTGVGLYGDCGLSLAVQDGKPVIEWNGQSELERNMEAYARAGFPEPPVWLVGRDIPAFCGKIAPVGSQQYAEAFRQIVLQVNAHGREAGWPEIIYQPVDEPFEHADRLANAMCLLKALKAIPGVRTEEDGMNRRWSGFPPEAYGLTDIFVLHDGPTLNRGRVDMNEWRAFLPKAAADGKTIWFYNIDLTGWHPEPMRFMAGFGLWKSGATGVVEWSYMGPVKEDNPATPYGQPNALLYRLPKAPDESGGPTIGYEGFREGVDDYRYLLTLSQLVEKARKSGSRKATLAEEIWAPVQAKMDQASFECCKGSAAQGDWTGPCDVLPDSGRSVSGDHKIENNWQFEDYDALRRQVAQGVVRLSQMDEGQKAQGQ